MLLVRYGKRGHGLYDHIVSTIFQAFPDHVQKMCQRRNKQRNEKYLTHNLPYLYHFCLKL